MTEDGNRFIATLRGHFRDRAAEVFCWHIQQSGETVVTWGQLERDCEMYLAAYRALGMRPGDQVLIFLRHVTDLYPSYFGAMLGCFIPSFMPCSSPRQDPALYWSSHQSLLNHIRPRALVASKATLDEMRQAGLSLDGVGVLATDELRQAGAIFADTSADKIALLQHSSGTTGLKKGVALSYDAIVRQLDSYASSIRLDRRNDVIVSWLPLYHDMGLIACLMLPAYFAVPFVHLDPFHWLARPDILFEQIRKRRGTLTWLPNFAFEHLSGTLARRAAQYDLSSVRAMINCSEPCKAATFDRFAQSFASAHLRPEALQCCYAMAETVFAVSQTTLAEQPQRLRVDPATLDRGTRPVPSASGIELIETGLPLAGIDVSIRDEGGAPLTGGEIGEIAMSGEFLFSGYNRDPERSAERLRGGTYHSRDLGFIHDGHVYVLGRMDDLIIINGRNLYAHEVEAQVNTVAGIKPGRAVAIGVFDERVGTEYLIVMAERQKAASQSDDTIRSEIQSAVHSVFNVTPRAISIVDEGLLIKTSSGKISRKENLTRFMQGQNR